MTGWSLYCTEKPGATGEIRTPDLLITSQPLNRAKLRWPGVASRRAKSVYPAMRCGGVRLTEMFRSLQGEGTRSGLPTVFVRFTGCDLRCTWCDTAYAFDGGTEVALDRAVTLVGHLAAGGAPRRLDEVALAELTPPAHTRAPLVREVCLTGGEPLLQPESLALADALLAGGYRLSVETSGSHDVGAWVARDLLVSLDVKCPGSGMAERNRWENLALLRDTDQVKLVLAQRDDLAWARAALEAHPTAAPVVLTPVDGVALRWLADALVHEPWPEARLLPQLHKLLWGAAAGV